MCMCLDKISTDKGFFRVHLCVPTLGYYLHNIIIYKRILATKCRKRSSQYVTALKIFTYKKIETMLMYVGKK